MLSSRSKLSSLIELPISSQLGNLTGASTSISAPLQIFLNIWASSKDRSHQKAQTLISRARLSSSLVPAPVSDTKASLKFLRLKAATLIFAVRDIEKSERARDAILADDEVQRLNPNADVTIMRLDLVDFQSVIDFADRVLREVKDLHVLLLNAGVNLAHLEKSPAGNEMCVVEFLHCVFDLKNAVCLSCTYQKSQNQKTRELLTPTASQADSSKLPLQRPPLLPPPCPPPTDIPIPISTITPPHPNRHLRRLPRPGFSTLSPIQISTSRQRASCLTWPIRRAFPASPVTRTRKF